MKEAIGEVKDEITGVGVEDAIIRYFEGVDLAIPGRYVRGNKQITVERDEKEKVLSITATLNGVERAIIKSYYGSLYSAYFRLLGEDVDGVRDEVIYNRFAFGDGVIELSRVPGVDLENRRITHVQAERLEIASRLGIKLNVPPPPKVRILR